MAGMFCWLVLSLSCWEVTSSLVLHEYHSPQVLGPLTSYSSLSVTSWSLPGQSRLATWTIQSSSPVGCSPPANITIWLKAGGLPVIVLDQGRLPPQMVPVVEEQLSVSLMSGTEKTISVWGPEPGPWYLAAGYTAHTERGDCQPVISVMAEYLVETNVITVIPTFYSYQDIRTFYTVNTTQTFKSKQSLCCPVTTPGLTAARPEKCPLVIRERARSVPAEDVTGGSLDCSVLPLSACSLKFDSQENSNHYVTVTVGSNRSDTTVQFAISVELQGCQLSPASAGALLVNSINTSLLCGEPNLRPVKVLFQSYSLEEGSTSQCGQVRSVLLARRRDRRGGAQFVRTGNISLTSPLILSPLRHTVLQFDTDQSDSGGSLAVEIAMSQSSHSSSLSVSGCLSRGFRTSPEYNVTSGLMECRHGRLVRQERRPGNSPVYEQVLVLYPPPGTWYLSLLLHCPHSANHCSAPVLFSVHTDQCVSGVCGRYGHCHSYLSSGLLYSACSCFAGHRGLACNDPSQAMSDYHLLISSLLLTTSNLAMLPAIMLAAYRGHYTECVVFTAHLIASCLYHACAEQVYSVCLLSVSVLSWSDGFTTVLTIWVTVLTIARLPVTLRSVINMLAVISLAVLVEHTNSVTMTTIIPTLVSLVILVICLVVRCAQTGQCCPSSKYFFLHFLPGLALLALSIFCSALTKPGGFTHVGEHVARGIAVLLLLPKDKHRKERERKVQTQSSNPVYRQTEVSFKQLTDSNQSSVDDMAVIRDCRPGTGLDRREDSMHQL